MICLHQLSLKTSGPNKRRDAQHLLFFRRLKPPLRHEGQTPRLLYDLVFGGWFSFDLHVTRVTAPHEHPSPLAIFCVRVSKTIHVFKASSVAPNRC